MPNELVSSFSVEYDDGQQPPQAISVTRRFRSITTKRPNVMVQSIPTSETAILLGAASGLGGTLVVVNLDPSNFVTIYNATGGQAVARLDPDTDSDGKGGFMVVDRLGANMLAPYAKADTAACQIAILTCPP